MVVSDEFQLPSAVSPVITALAFQKNTDCVTTGVPFNDPVQKAADFGPEKNTEGTLFPPPNDASTNVSPIVARFDDKNEYEGMTIGDGLIAVERGDDDILPSISWESKGEIASNSIGTNEFDTSFASTIPVANHAD